MADEQVTHGFTHLIMLLKSIKHLNMDHLLIVQNWLA